MSVHREEYGSMTALLFRNSFLPQLTDHLFTNFDQGKDS